MRLFVLASAVCLFAAPAWASDWTELDTDEDGYTIDEGDCDDGNPDINPGVKEVCEDEIDNDCDLAIDFEDPECTACGACSAGPFGSPAATVGVLLLILGGGVCRFGLRRGRPPRRPAPPAA